MKIILIPVSLLFLIVAGSCKKNSDSPPVSNKSKTELLTNESWKLDVSGYDNDMNGTVDLVNNGFQPCEKDNLYIYYTNGEGLVDEGALKCSTTQSYPFTWSFKDNEMAIDYGNGVTRNIFSLNETNLKINVVLNPGTANVSNYLYIYKH